MWYSLLLLGYKPVQHVTVLNTVGNCNTIILYYIILHYIIMGPPSYMRSVVMWRMPVIHIQFVPQRSVLNDQSVNVV